MGLMEQAAALIKQVTSDTNGFASPVVFTTTNGQTVTSKTCNAVVTIHGLHIDDRGMVVVAPTSRVMVSELALITVGFPTRDSNSKLALKGVTLTITDAMTGIQATYIVRENIGNNMTGLTTLTLGTVGTVTPPGRIIIGWMAASIIANPVDVVTGATQVLANGDIIPSEYVLVAGNLVIPYMIGYNALSTFLVESNSIQNMPYNKATGKFLPTPIGEFVTGTEITFDASIPIWQS